MAVVETGAKAQVVSATDVLCEGPIYGLVSGAASVYLNNNSAENVKFNSYAPVDTGTVNGQAAGTITFNNSTLGTIDNNTVLPDSLNNSATAPRDIRLLGSGEARVPVNLSNFSDSGESRSQIRLSRPNGNWDSNFHNTVFGEIESVLEILYADGTKIRIFGNFVRDSNNNGDFNWSKANGALDADNLPAQGLLLTFKLSKVSSLDLFNKQVTTVDSFNGTFSFELSSQFTFEANSSSHGGTFNPSAPISKVSNLFVQENTGTLLQRPLPAVAGIGGNTTIQGSTSNVNLPVLKVIIDTNSHGVTPIDLEGLPVIDEDDYKKRDRSLVDTSDCAQDPSILNASDFGLTTVAKVQEADKVSFNILYSQGLYFIGGSSGKKRDSWAWYEVSIEFQQNSNTWVHPTPLFGEYLKHRGQTNAAITFQQVVDLNEFSDINYTNFRIKIFRVTRHIGLPVMETGGSRRIRGGPYDNRRKWTTLMGAEITQLQAINEDSFSYPYTAHVQTTFSSRAFTSPPKRTYDIRGKLVKVPNGYVPREASPIGKAEYPIFWDGSLSDTLVYTDNPAWIFLDLVTNSRYGAGSWLSNSDIDLFALYRISKFCDELVDSKELFKTEYAERGEWYKIVSLGNANWNTFAGTFGVTYSVGDEVRSIKKHTSTGTISRLEPRFRTNLLLTKSVPVYKVLKDLTSMFLSMLYWTNGKLTLVQDMPQNPVATFSKSNTIDGAFSYESSSYTTRVNQVIVQWNNPRSNYSTEKIVIEDNEAIVKAGKLIPLEVVAFGCTSESQATRYGKWKLYTAQNENEIVLFSTALEGKIIRPGDVVNVQDSDRQNFIQSGRVSAATSTTITFDRSVTLSSSSVYEVYVSLPGGGGMYVGSSPVTINSIEYAPGAFIPSAYNYVSGGLQLVSLDTEQKATNAFDSAGNLLNVEWRPHVRTERLPIINTGTSETTVTLDNSLTFDFTPSPGSIWSLRETETSGEEVYGTSKTYRVLSVSQDNPLSVSIRAAEQFTDKFIKVEDEDREEVLEEIIPENEEEEVPPPIALSIQPMGGLQSILKFKWSPPENYPRVAQYEVVSSVGTGETVTTTNLGKVYREVEVGTHTFKVRTESTTGDFSEWASTVFEGSGNSVGDEDQPENSSAKAHGIPKCGVASSKGVIRRDSVASSAEKYSKTSPKFYVVKQDIAYTNRTVTAYRYFWNDVEVRKVSALPNDVQDISGNRYTQGTQQEVDTSNANITETYFAIKSTSTAGAEGAEVFEFLQYPVTIATCGSPDLFTEIASRSPNGFVDLSGVIDDDTRELYIYYDASVPRVFLAEWDSNANTIDSPGFWRDANQPMSAAWTALTGTAFLAANSTILVGTGTSFISEVEPGDIISLANLSTQVETLGSAAKVNYVLSNGQLVLDRSFISDISLTNFYRATHRGDPSEDSLLVTISRPT